MCQNKDKARQILGIPKNCIVLTTIGFDVTIKGFDVLADAVESLVKKTTPPYLLLM